MLLTRNNSLMMIFSLLKFFNICEHLKNFLGYVVQGSNGEYVLLSHKERVDMVSFVRENTGIDKLIIAGSACEGTSFY